MMSGPTANPIKPSIIQHPKPKLTLYLHLYGHLAGGIQCIYKDMGIEL